MSADNWTKCPRCGRDGEDDGGLREDYEVGIWNGQFHADYSGICMKRGVPEGGQKFGRMVIGCGFEYKRQFSEDVK
jgi:hypothetical protein